MYTIAFRDIDRELVTGDLVDREKRRKYVKAVCKYGSDRWLRFGKALRKYTRVDIVSPLGEQSYNSDKLEEITDSWIDCDGTKVTVDQFLEACEEIGIREQVEQELLGDNIETVTAEVERDVRPVTSQYSSSKEIGQPHCHFVIFCAWMAIFVVLVLL